ncbi:CHAD domain-containing protein [Oculatella sp. LEGE 06141]|uniref:CHAD domain-containing protein n=1 Tax=Oculatella sp. LEGE 06141 TaxID=1828648 RepID=UPI0018801062|nr:CHAD domain-containing protein [Oculatella sp. LEGE 06141]MBE9183056.1 CHAD domain-containing protein [Oculatella sp. LEGE 06141]
MAYQLKPNEPVSRGIKRIVLEQIDKALEQLTGKAGTSEEKAVHESRKRFKQIRAVIRLVQEDIGKATYKRENACFRDIGRLLSDVRDAQVRIETLDKLTAHFSEAIAPDQFAKVRQTLEADYRSTQNSVPAENNPTTSAIAMLKKARKRVDDWPFQHDDWFSLQHGLNQMYKQGKEAFRVAGEQPTAENMHEWRKRVKDLWYHLKILQPVWPGMMAEQIEQAHLLANDLGDDHDLAVLCEFVTTQPKRFNKKDRIDELVNLIGCRREQLQMAAKLRGQRLYAERAKAFVDRIKAYWQVWQTEAEMPSPKKPSSLAKAS